VRLTDTPTRKLPALSSPEGEGLVSRFGANLAALQTTLPLGIAVSGGPDSVGLLLLAHAAFPGQVAAATVDHGLRPDAAAEARHVADICRDLGIDHQILTVQVEHGGQGLQAAARAARYAALTAWCEATGLPTLATAHHADDQAETLLMRLARGAGVGGLAGIRAERPLSPTVRLIRPLLDWRKAELTAIVADAGVAACDDPSNRDDRFDRTAMRALLAATPALDPARLAAAAAHLADADAALDWAAARAFAASVARSGDCVSLDPADYPPEIIRRMLVRLFAEHDVFPDGPALERLVAALRAGSATTLAGLRARPGAVWRFDPAPPRRPTR
jgi:tRNA(Ile)-lysidine synthase